MKRRGFLGSILAAGFAPAFVGSTVLMPVKAIAKPRQWQDLLNTDAMDRAVDKDLLVYLNGVLLHTSDYVANSHGLVTLKQAPMKGDVLIVHKARQIDSFALTNETQTVFAG